MAACGIYMRDIIDAVPIDKYFEMFKPGGCQRRGLCAPIQQGGGGVTRERASAGRVRENTHTPFPETHLLAPTHPSLKPTSSPPHTLP